MARNTLLAASAGNAPAPPFTSLSAAYSGVSGPGHAVIGAGTGGWRSGTDGVIYSGPNPKPGWSTDFGDRATGSAVDAGLIPAIKPIWELHLRDTVMCVGGDGKYYMTGSSGDNIWDRNDGVELWRSSDFIAWDYLGLVWSIERDGSWQREWRTLHGKPARAVWAPEIHYFHGNYFICLCMAPGGIALLKSSTGKPEGPYVSALAEDKPLNGSIDPTLFCDDDGKVYFTYGGGSKIAQLKDDLSGLAQPIHTVSLVGPDTIGSAIAGRPAGRIGREGATLFKANGVYYLGAADWPNGRYSSMVAQSDSVYGPYRLLHEAVPCGGGTGYFRDNERRYWCTFFGNDSQAPWREKPGMLQVDFDGDGKIIVSKKQPLFVKRNG